MDGFFFFFLHPPNTKRKQLNEVTTSFIVRHSFSIESLFFFLIFFKSFEKVSVFSIMNLFTVKIFSHMIRSALSIFNFIGLFLMFTLLPYLLCHIDNGEIYRKILFALKNK